MRVIGKSSVASVITVLLNIAWYGLGLTLVVALFVLAFAAFAPSHRLAGAELGIPVSFSVNSRIHVAAPSLGVDGAEIEDVRGTLKFAPQNRASIVAPLIGLAVMLGVVLWVIGQLRAVFRTLTAGQPFVPANARRIRSIAVAVIAGEIARAVVVFFSNWVVMTNFRADGLQFNANPNLNVVAIINGLIILVIAEVFRAGTRLDEDQSLTV